MVERKKELAQVWTPDYIADEMLNEIGYVSSNTEILKQKVMEPSFGAGVFLYEILQRLVDCALINGKNNQEIEYIIDNNVYAIDYDIDIYTLTIEKIKEWLSETYSLKPSLPHFYNMDTLDYKQLEYFDYVIGNPPYIRIHDMPEDMRLRVKKYAYSTGTADLYVIFFEIGINLLNSNGKLGYITPNSWLRNVSQRSFRKNLIDEGQLQKIINFNAEKVFDNVGTYTCISYMSKQDEKSLTYIDSSKNLKNNYVRNIAYSEIDLVKNDSLAFPCLEDQIILDEHLLKEGRSLSNLCKIQNGIATLGDEFFLINNEDLGPEDYVYPIVKGSKYKGEDISQKIIFPYVKSGTKFKGITEESLTESPIVHDILVKNKEKLSARSLDKGSSWFWYGRSQSIQETDKEKIVFSPIIGPNQEIIKTYVIPANTLVYSGLFITVNDTSLFEEPFTIQEIRNIVESETFIKYCRIVGKDLSGGYKSVSSNMIKKYKI